MKFTFNKPPSAPSPKPPPKSQEEIKEMWQRRFKSLKPEIEEGIKRYDQALKEGTFEDQEGETEGEGEKRKAEMRRELTDLVDKAKSIKARLDSEKPLPEINPQITTTFEYQDPNNQKQQEQITLDIEEKLKDFTSFYQETNIDLPPNFEESILDIWQSNEDQIEQEMRSKGFNDMLIIPPNIPISDLTNKMSMGNGYYLGENFKNEGGFSKVISPHTDKPRIILIHNVQNIIEDTKYGGANTKNITGADAQKHEPLSLEEYMIFQKKYHQKTNTHLDSNGWTWTSSKVGSHLVHSGWDPGGGRLYVLADDPDFRVSRLGVRPSRCFI